MLIPSAMLRKINMRRVEIPAAATRAQCATPQVGRCTRVQDADGITLQTPFKSVCIRFWGADAPEVNQPAFREAIALVFRLCARQYVYFVPKDTDRYGRIVAQVLTMAGQDVALELLSAGLAWYTPRFALEMSEYRAAQKYARFYRLGLWADPNPTPPWRFRAALKKKGLHRHA